LQDNLATGMHALAESMGLSYFLKWENGRNNWLNVPGFDQGSYFLQRPGIGVNGNKTLLHTVGHG
jgi:hypothetical protein